MKADSLAPAQMESLRRLSTCIVSSSIERFGVRLPNTGFADSIIRSIFEDLPPVLGYAATVRIRTSEPPMEGHGYYGNTRVVEPYSQHSADREWWSSKTWTTRRDAAHSSVKSTRIFCWRWDALAW